MPIHGVNVGGSGLSLVSGREDFQAFEMIEQIDLQIAINANQGGFSSNNKAFGYGFVARRCVPNCAAPTSFVRNIPANGITGFDQGLMTIALRIPRSSGTAYNFRMTFAVVNEPIMRTTKSIYAPETTTDAEDRLTDLGATTNSAEVMQLGLSRAATQSSNQLNKGSDQMVASNTGSTVTYAPIGLGLKPTIAAGNAHSLAVKQDGTVIGWGSDSYGQLGNNSALDDQSTPVAVSGTSGIVAIAAGGYHSLALKSDGTLLSWGYDVYGQLGDGGTNASQATPVAVSNTGGIAAITAGFGHSLAVKQNATLLGWGYDSVGQLGDGGTFPGTNQPTPVSVLLGTFLIRLP